jgi:hypothetical protein
MSQAKAAALKDLKEVCHPGSEVAPLYTDFALEPGMFGEEMMEWDLLDETDVPQTTGVASSCGGLLSKTIHLTKTPFPELPNIEDKCAGIVEALRTYATAHNFAVTVEDYATVDRPAEKTMMVVLHCLGSCCSYQVALLWVVGLTRWDIFCQPDGIFVHGCGRLEDETPCSAMATAPLNQALDHLVDFLNGEVVFPDENIDVANCNWKTEEKPAVSEHVRKETHKAVAKAAGIEATASAA